MGNHIRNIIMVYYDDSATPVRIQFEFPTDWRIEVGRQDRRCQPRVEEGRGEEPLRSRPTTPGSSSTRTPTTPTASRQREPASVVPTVSGTTIEFIGTFTSTGGTMRILTNDVAVQG